MDWLWYGKGPGARLAATVLTPTEMLYRLALRLRPSANPASLPVISVGNLTVGGSGKTTLVIDLAQRLQRRGWRVAIVSRGYGRKVSPPLAFDSSAIPSVRAAGDEPVLMARRLPGVKVLVDTDRRRAALRALEEFGAQVILADDAFQHRRLGRILDIVAINAVRGLGNGHLLPAGPMREPLSALERAHMVVFTYAHPEQDEEVLRQKFALPQRMPVAICCIQPAGFVRGAALEPVEAPQGAVVAFCGVGDAKGFFASCAAAGLTMLKKIAFPDHHLFAPKDLERLERLCRHLGATAVCSEKDLVRIEREVHFPLVALRSRVWWKEEKRLESLLDQLRVRLEKGAVLP